MKRPIHPPQHLSRRPATLYLVVVLLTSLCTTPSIRTTSAFSAQPPPSSSSSSSSPSSPPSSSSSPRTRRSESKKEDGSTTTSSTGRTLRRSSRSTSSSSSSSGPRRSGVGGPKGAAAGGGGERSRRTTTTTSRRSSRPARDPNSRRKSSSSSSSNRRSTRSRGGAAAAAEEEIFDPKAITASQSANVDAKVLSLFSTTNDDGNDGNEEDSHTSCPPPLRLRSSAVGEVAPQLPNSEQQPTPSSTTTTTTTKAIPSPAVVIHGTPLLGVTTPHFEQLSLDTLFPNNTNLQLSTAFYTDANFREAIRTSMRHDIFHSTPAYEKLSPKVAELMLDDDSSLQGSWNCRRSSRIPASSTTMEEEEEDSNTNTQDVSSERAAPSATTTTIRMKTLTTVLRDKLGSNAPDGDQFIMALGGLCGVNPSTHWIDIIGIKDRRVTHAWHQDTGRSVSSIFPKNEESTSTDTTTNNSNNNNDNDNERSDSNSSCYTVMLGFPCEDDYDGAGVFSHVVKLAEEHVAPAGHNVNEPILFEGVVEEDFIVRPAFGLGKEILRYRDVDVLHSAPDAQYRSSVMRFM